MSTRELLAPAHPGRQVVCPHCRRVLTVARRAMSTTCASCYKGVTLEDTVVRGAWSGPVATGGNVTVARGASCGGRGGLRASGDVDVQGTVRGDVASGGSVRVSSRGCVEGCVHATSLLVEPGGTLVAPTVRIAPP
ncbi:MAG: polymer-forming cytoskeletal protein [Planctomycetota bacterium]|nr:polymer-forming cytoskeletal protein [Planctomycetota bacterium]